ncbi:MAG TPA: TerD family protein [Pseudobacteroides sp.]|uniref:TerD family protein n=1 Tax=Pseudobacteroides sp. TaxID=1968840 RepID=UPI002F9361F3
MSQSLQPGGNITLGALKGTVIITHKLSQEVDTSLTAFLLADNYKVRGDGDIVFYNQPQGPGGMAVYYPPKDEAGERAHKISFDISKAEAGITRIAVTLTEDKGNGFAKVQNLKASVQVGNDVIELMPITFKEEKGIVVLELYIRNGQPKVKSVWQGFSSGLDGLCKHFGVEVAKDDSQAAKHQKVKPQEVEVQQVKVSELKAPDVKVQDAQVPNVIEEEKPTVNLQKVTGKVNLSKGQNPVIIDKTAEITSYVTWDSGTDYDIYALVLTKEGKQIDVAMFGAEGVLPLQNFGNGTVEHMGDVGRSDNDRGFLFFRSSKKGKADTKTEIIKIRPNDNVLAVVPVVYSAQSNGTGSFYRYRASMTIDNNEGTTVSISSENANDDDLIYTCIPGIILNTPEGIVIDPVEMYSRPGSEKRPKLKLGTDGKVKVFMDAGPENDFK